MKNRIGSAVLVMAALALPALGDLPPITTSALQESGGYVPSITVGPDGAVWFLDADKNLIGRSPLSGGAVTTYPVPTPNAGLSLITAGADGNLWFIESPTFDTMKLGKITTGGAITEYPVTGLTFPFSFASGPDGNLWLVATAGSGGPGGKVVIAKFSTSGASAGTISLPGNPANVKIAPGPGNAMWFHDRGDNTVGFISSGGAVQSFPFKTTDTAGGFRAAGGLTAGPDGNEWVAHSAAVARVTPTGTITEYQVPGAGFISGVAKGADGNIWFLDHANGKIGRLIVASATDQGTATIDQGSAGVGSPSALFPVTVSKTKSRAVPLATCAAEEDDFIEESDDTPPPHIEEITIQPASKCADLSFQWGSVQSDIFRSWILDEALISATITNNGPDTVKPSITATSATPLVTSTHGNGAWVTINGNTVTCTTTVSTVSCVLPSTDRPGVPDKNVLAQGQTAQLDILVESTLRSLTILGQVSGNLPDPVPSNNTSSGTFDVALAHFTPLPPSDPPVVAIVTRH